MSGGCFKRYQHRLGGGCFTTIQTTTTTTTTTITISSAIPDNKKQQSQGHRLQLSFIKLTRQITNDKGNWCQFNPLGGTF